MTGSDIGSHPNGLIDFRLASAVARHIAFVSAWCGGNLQWTADELGVNVSTVRRILARQGGTVERKAGRPRLRLA